MKTSLAIIHSSCISGEDPSFDALKDGIRAGQGVATTINVRNATARIECLQHFDGIVFQPGQARFDSTCEFTALMRASENCRIKGLWRDKVAAVSEGLSENQPDPFYGLLTLSLFCASHHMIWVSRQQCSDATGQHTLRCDANGAEWSTNLDTDPVAAAYDFGRRLTHIARVWQQDKELA